MDQLLKKGAGLGLNPSQIEEALTLGRPAKDGAWIESQDLLEMAQKVADETMEGGRYIEYCCYDSSWAPQGRAVVQLIRWEPDGDFMFVGDHGPSSDGYYDWYVKQIGPSGFVFHICAGEASKCKAKKARGDARELIHIDKWRMLTPKLMLSLFLRTGELVDLKANQVSLAARHSSQSVVYLNQTKTTKRNNLPLEKIIVDEELAHRALEELLVGLAPGETLSQLSHYQFRRLWHDLIHSLKLTGCGFAPYSLRRGGATSAYRAGVPLDALVTKGRWAHLATCRLYLDQGAQALAEFKLPAASRPALAAASRKFLSVSQQGTRGMRAACKRKTQ